MKKLAVLFPGNRYSPECPLLYFAAKECRQAGYDLLPLYYSYRQDAKLGESFDYMKFAREALPLIREKLEVLPEYDQVLFISKSIGTVLAGYMEQELSIRPRQFLMTPIPEALPYMEKMDGRAAAVIGTKDHYFLSSPGLTALCQAHSIPLKLYDGLGHRLEAGTTEETLRILEDIMKNLRDFIR